MDGSIEDTTPLKAAAFQMPESESWLSHRDHLFQQQQIIDSAVSTKQWSCLAIVLREHEWTNEKCFGGWDEKGAPFLQGTVGKQVPCVAPSTVT